MLRWHDPAAVPNEEDIMANVVTRNDELGRYEIRVDGELAGFTEFVVGPEVTELPHTEVDSKFAGQGLAKVLIGGALDDFRERGTKIIAQCEFVAGFIAKNPAYQDLLA
ncbi:MAG: GNAT family N-acetyltransferase [Jatrophihabitantaceae bacterium]